MKRLILPLVALLLPLLTPVPVMALSDAEAVNISGRQRMLTQRMMKNHLLIGAEIQTDKGSTATGRSRCPARRTASHCGLQPRKGHQGNRYVLCGCRTSFQLEDSGRYVPTVIAVTTDSILTHMDAITQYQDLMQ